MRLSLPGLTPKDPGPVRLSHRHVLILIGFILFAGTAAAQGDMLLDLEIEAEPFQVGTWDIGGGFSFESMSGEAYEDSAGNGRLMITLTPSLEYFLAEKFSAGAIIRLENYSHGDSSETNIWFGPSAHYYFARPRSDHHPFIYGTLQYRTLSLEPDSLSNAGSWVRFEFGPGLHNFLNPQLAYVLQLYAAYDSHSPETGDGSSGIEVGFWFGIRAHFFKED